MKIVIERALDRYDLANKYFLRHVEVLKHYGVKGVSTMNPEWKYNDNIHMIMAFSEHTKEMIGAVRIEVNSSNGCLPIQSAIASTGSDVSNMINYLHQNGGVAEICGLWISPDTTETNVPVKLMQAAISHTEAIKIDNIIGFANEYSKPSTEKLGFRHLDNIENDGIYYYPTEEYKTYVIHKSFTNAVIPTYSI